MAVYQMVKNADLSANEVIFNRILVLEACIRNYEMKKKTTTGFYIFCHKQKSDKTNILFIKHILGYIAHTYQRSLVCQGHLGY